MARDPQEVWEVIDRHGEPRYVVRLDHPGDFGGGYVGICQPDDPAHCHLISAAPELLLLVRGFLLFPAMSYEERAACIADARAAVAKAEGR